MTVEVFIVINTQESAFRFTSLNLPASKHFLLGSVRRVLRRAECALNFYLLIAESQALLHHNERS